MIVCPISSQLRWYLKPGPGDHPLRNWKAVGLRHPSTARVSNLLAVEKKLIKRVLGALSANDCARVQAGLREAFRPLMEGPRGEQPAELQPTVVMALLSKL